ncbi:MAG: ParB/RepB/Spo0J family partition protein [Gemmatimonadetes bacterium]|nr:ParB/RepB/Spo0J family partition protein [Gemmatimonadota bacterium]
MQKRDRLGRGLEALLGDYLTPLPADAGAVRQLAVSAIAPNRFQPRREFSDSELAELTESIRANGLLQPVIVRPAREGSLAAWELVAGERRWRAVLRLGWREIPALVRDVDDPTLLVLALVENLQRSGLSPLEEAAGYERLASEFGLSHQQIAEAVGRDRSTVVNMVRLLQLPAAVRRLLAEGKLTAGHARALLGLEDERRIVELADEAVRVGWNVREVERQVRRRRGHSEPEAAAGPRDPTELRLEEELQRALGAAVRIRRARGTAGRIEIPFSGPEDFERLYELLTRRSVLEVTS